MLPAITHTQSSAPVLIIPAHLARIHGASDCQYTKPINPSFSFLLFGDLIDCFFARGNKPSEPPLVNVGPVDHYRGRWAVSCAYARRIPAAKNLLRPFPPFCPAWRLCLVPLPVCPPVPLHAVWASALLVAAPISHQEHDQPPYRRPARSAISSGPRNTPVAYECPSSERRPSSCPPPMRLAPPYG